jgi:hypothetical protein
MIVERSMKKAGTHGYKRAPRFTRRAFNTCGSMIGI